MGRIKGRSRWAINREMEEGSMFVGKMGRGMKAVGRIIKERAMEE